MTGCNERLIVYEWMRLSTTDLILIYKSFAYTLDEAELTVPQTGSIGQ